MKPDIRYVVVDLAYQQDDTGANAVNSGDTHGGASFAPVHHDFFVTFQTGVPTISGICVGVHRGTECCIFVNETAADIIVDCMIVCVVFEQACVVIFEPPTSYA